MGNDNGLVNYCASRLGVRIRQGVLRDEKAGVSSEQGSKLLKSYNVSFRIIFTIWCKINVSFKTPILVIADLYAS